MNNVGVEMCALLRKMKMTAHLARLLFSIL